MSRKVDPVTGLGGAYVPSVPEEPALVAPVTVRTIRPHDTAFGFKEPGDEYQRSGAEARALRDAGVLSIVTKRTK